MTYRIKQEGIRTYLIRDSVGDKEFLVADFFGPVTKEEAQGICDAANDAPVLKHTVEERLWAARENLKRAVGVLQEVKRSGLPDESIDPRFALGSQVWVVCDDIEKSLKSDATPDLYTLTECESAATMAHSRNEQVSDMLKEIRARRKS